METELDPEYCTFEEAIKVKHYVENECWINTLMSRAMFEFNKSLSNPLHKSYYNDIDVDIVNRCRTVAPAGTFHYFYHSNELHIEIDQNKA